MKVHFKDKLDVFTEAQIHCLKKHGTYIYVEQKSSVLVSVLNISSYRHSLAWVNLTTYKPSKPLVC